VATGGGGVTTEVSLITSGFEEGVNKIVGLVGTINSALAKIGEVAIGASLGSAIEKIVGDLNKLPESIIQSAAKMESAAASMGSAMEIAAKRASEAWNQAGAEIDASVQKAQQGVDKAAREMANSLEGATQKAAEFAQQMERAGETAQRGFAANNQQLSRSVEDASTRGGQAAEDLTTTLSRASQDYTRRLSNIQAESTQRISNIMGAYTDASGERTRVFNQGMNNIEFGLNQSTTRIAHTQRDVMEKFGEQIEGIHSNTANRISSINASFAESSNKINTQIENENEKFQQGIELREAAHEDSTNKLALQHEDTMKTLSDSWDKLTRHSADAAEKITRQVADQMAALRDAEEKANIEFSRKMADLAEETLIGPKTQEQQNQLAKRRIQLGTDLADNQQAIDKKKAQVAKQAAEERADLQKQTEEQQQEIIKRQNKEEELYQRRLEFIDAQYARENLKAEENHQRTIAQLNERLDAEARARDRAVAQAKEQGEAQEEAAKKNLAIRLRSIAEQEQAEREQAEHQRQNLEANYAAQQRLAANAVARQIADVQANAERQTEAAKVQYDRQVEDANRAYSRITDHLNTQSKRAQEDWATTNDNIQRKWDETSQNIQQAAANSARQSAIEYEKMGDRYNEAVQKMRTAIDTFNETHSNKAAQVAAMFSDAWVKSFNEVQAAAGRVQKAEFIDPADPDKFQKSADQMTRIAKEMSVSMGKDAGDVASSMAALALSNLDPLQNDLLQTTAAMSTLPQVTRGMTQVVNAFGALATGQIGEANQRFREFGVNLKDIPGLVFDANGKIETSEEKTRATTEALAAAMKTSVEDIKQKFPEVSQQILQLVEVTFKERYAGVLQNWLKTTEGQFAQAKAIFNNFKLDIGKEFLDGIRGPLTEFVTFLKENQGNISQIGANIGQEMAKFASYIVDGLKRLSQTDVVEAFTKLLNSLGNLKDQIINAVQSISIALAGGDVDFGGALAKGIENFAKLLDKAAKTIEETNFGDVAEKIRKGFFGAGDAAESEGGKFEAALGTLMSALGTFASFVVDNGADIIKFFAGLTEAATNFAKFVLEHGDQIKPLIEIFASMAVVLKGLGIAKAIGADIAKLGEIFTFVKNAVSPLLALLRGPLLGVLINLGVILDGLVTSFISVASSLSVQLVPILARLAPLMAPLVTGVELVTGAILAWLASLGPLEVALLAIAAAFTGAFVLKLTTGIDLLTPLWETFGGTIQKVIDLLGQLAIIAANPALAAGFAIFKNLFPEAAKDVETFGEELKRKIAGIFGIQIDDSAKQELGNQFTEAIDNARKAAFDALTGLKDALAERLSGIIQAGEIADALAGVGKTIADSLAQGVTPEEFEGLKQQLIESLKASLAALESVPGEESTKLQDQIKSMIDAAATAVSPEDLQPVVDAVQNGLKPIADAGKESTQALIDQIDNTLQNGDTLTTENINNIVAGAREELSKLPDEARGPVEEFVNNLEQIANGISPIKDSVDQNIGGVGDIIQGAMDTAQGAVNTATGVIGSAFSTMQGTIGTAVDGVQSKVDEFTTGAGKAFDSLTSSIGETGAWQAFTKQLGDAVEAAQYLGKEFLEFESIILRIGGRALGALASNIQQSMADIKTTMDGVVADVGKAFDQIGQELSTSAVAAAMQAVKDNVSQSWADIQQTFSDAATGIQTALELIGQEISGSGAASGIQTLKDNVTQSWTDIQTTFANAGTDIQTAMGLIANEIATSGLASALGQVKTNIETSWGDIQKTFGEVADLIPTTFDKAVQGAQSSLNSFIDFMGEWIGKIPGVLGGLFDVLLNALVQPWIDIYFKIKEALLEISGASLIDDWFATLTNNLPKWAADAMTALIDAFKTGFENLITELKDQFDGVASTIKEGVAAAFDSITKLWEQTISPGFNTVIENLPTALASIKDMVSAWATDLINTIKTILSPESISGAISAAFSGMKDTIMNSLHEIHGSGVVDDWLLDLNKTMVDSLSQTVIDSSDAFSGIAEVVGDELSAASEEVTLFVSSLGEATNEVNKDMSNIISAAKSGSAGIDRFTAQKLAFGDTRPSGGAGGGGGAAGGGGGGDKPEFEQLGFKSLDAMLNAAEKMGGSMDDFRLSLAKVPDEIQRMRGKGGIGPSAAQQKEESQVNQLLGRGQGQESPAMQQANQRLTQAGNNLSQAGKELTDMAKTSAEAQKQNFQNLVKGISSGQAAWSGAAKTVNQGAQAWTGAATNVSKMVTGKLTGGANQQPTGPTGPTGPTAGGPLVQAPQPQNNNFAVNVSTINVENGDTIDFMQTYIDQYAALLNGGATL